MIDIRYSIFIPYCNRLKEFRLALQSYSNRYKNIRNDFEFVIVEDGKNHSDIDKHVDLLKLCDEFRHLNIVHAYGDAAYNPAKHFNYASRLARGKYFVLTNPETAITCDVFGLLDDEIAKDTAYIMCSCANCDNVHINGTLVQGRHIEWYQHSVNRNTRLHFYSVLSKNIYNYVGGFDEEFVKGIGYEDNDFANNLIKHGVEYVYRDNISTIHIMHDKSYQTQYRDLNEINRVYYETKWKDQPRVDLT